jgi:hypothetical protein
VEEVPAAVDALLAFLPPSPVLVQSDKTALDDSAFGHHRDGMPLTTSGDLYRHILA